MYKVCDNFQRVEGCKMISPHHFHPTNGVSPEDSNNKHIACYQLVRHETPSVVKGEVKGDVR